VDGGYDSSERAARSRIGASGRDVCHRLVEVWMIKKIKELETHPKRSALPELGIFHHCEVRVEEIRATELVATLCYGDVCRWSKTSKIQACRWRITGRWIGCGVRPSAGSLRGWANNVCQYSATIILSIESGGCIGVNHAKWRSTTGEDGS